MSVKPEEIETSGQTPEPETYERLSLVGIQYVVTIQC